jgi:hypothetical protein
MKTEQRIYRHRDCEHKSRNLISAFVCPNSQCTSITNGTSFKAPEDSAWCIDWQYGNFDPIGASLRFEAGSELVFPFEQHGFARKTAMT